MSFEDIHTWIYHLCVVMWVSDFLKFQSPHLWGFPGDADGKESACNVGDLGSVPGSGRPPREGDGNPCQYSYRESSMDRRTGPATVYGVAIELDMT